MNKEWIKIVNGEPKFKREHLLNHAMNNWGLNKTYSVGPTSELIRACTPKELKDWERFYFKNAVQKKKNGQQITREYLEELGRKLYVKLTEVVSKELNSINEEECIDYVYNLVINRTFEGYQRERDTVYGQLEKDLSVSILPSSDEIDRKYNVDFLIEIRQKYIGLQIKPLPTSFSIPQIHKERTLQKETHKKFTEKFGGEVFYVFSVKKIIQEKATLIKEIQSEMERLKSL